MKLHTSCSTLPIKNFYLANMTGDLRYLIEGYSEDDSAKYAEHKDSNQAQDALNKILEHHSILTRDKKTMQIRKLEYSYRFETGQLALIYRVLEIYDATQNFEVLLMLNELNCKFEVGDDISATIDRALHRAKVLKNGLNIKRNKIQKLSGFDPDKPKPKMEEVLASLDKSALSMEASLKLGYQIKVDEITTERWINMNNALEQMRKENQ